MSVSTAGIEQHSRANERLREGLMRLGVHCGEIPRNCGRGHGCGWCAFGCARGEKQDGTATFLPDAAAAGAKILTGAPLRFLGCIKLVVDASLHCGAQLPPRSPLMRTWRDAGWHGQLPG
jgi:hypothetical protein